MVRLVRIVLFGFILYLILVPHEPSPFKRLERCYLVGEEVSMHQGTLYDNYFFYEMGTNDTVSAILSYEVLVPIGGSPSLKIIDAFYYKERGSWFKWQPSGGTPVMVDQPFKYKGTLRPKPMERRVMV